MCCSRAEKEKSHTVPLPLTAGDTGAGFRDLVGYAGQPEPDGQPTEYGPHTSNMIIVSMAHNEHVQRIDTLMTQVRNDYSVSASKRGLKRAPVIV